MFAKEEKRNLHVSLKPCGAVFTVRAKLMIVPGMLVLPFIVLGFNACLAFGIKIHSFLCQEIKNSIVSLPELFQDHLFFFYEADRPDSISFGPMIWSPEEMLCPFLV